MKYGLKLSFVVVKNWIYLIIITSDCNPGYCIVRNNLRNAENWDSKKNLKKYTHLVKIAYFAPTNS